MGDAARKQAPFPHRRVEDPRSVQIASSPIRLFIIILVTIFLADTVVMLLLTSLHPSSFSINAFLDPLLLTFLLFPLLYIFFLRPMIACIHEGKRALSALQEGEEKYRSLVESTEDSIYLVDRDYRYLFINRRHLSRLGIADGNYIGRSYGEFHSPEITEKFRESVDEVFKAGISIQHEHKSLRDGDCYLLTLSPVRDAEGNTSAVTVVSKKITERKLMEEELRSLTLTDELTGLYNRRGFLTLAEQHLKIANRGKSRIFMLYADLDNLKGINDTFGHQEGDLVLIETANIFKEVFRDSDIVARIGGDEFVVMPVGTGEANAESVVPRLQRRLDIHNARMDRNYKLSVSIGITNYDPANPCTTEHLLAEGDRLMYEDKRRRQKSKQNVLSGNLL